MIKSVNKQNLKLTYEFSFVSLIAPFIDNTLKLNKLHSSNNVSKKILLKRSYLLLTWIYYLQASTSPREDKKITVAYLPSKKKSYTLNKAPMAHKTNSKEQFSIKFYFFKVSFITVITNTLFLDSVNKGFYFYFILKQTFPVFETNMFFLKFYKIYFHFKDENYFNYFKFSKLLK